MRTDDNFRQRLAEEGFPELEGESVSGWARDQRSTTRAFGESGSESTDVKRLGDVIKPPPLAPLIPSGT